jgi:GNAT superfamily N-acetyltransferase
MSIETSTQRNSGKTVVLNLPEDLQKAFPVIHQLRPHLNLEEFQHLAMLAQAADGYRLIAREVNGRVISVMGYRILHDLAHGSHLYIDDLVTTADERSRHHGAELLKWAEGECRRLGLTGLRLCAALTNKEGRKFYEREGWVERSVALKKKVPSH